MTDRADAVDPRVERLWACRDLDAVFHGDLAPVPWRRAPKGWLIRGGLRDAVQRLAVEPARLVEVDPRTLWANQPSVVATHARYYRSGEWQRTARTSADQGSRTNRFPIVVDDGDGRLVIVAGHHRSLAALIDGRPVRVRLLAADRAPADPAVALTPTLLVGDRTDLAAEPSADPDEAAARIDLGATVLVADFEIAAATLAFLDLDELERQALLAHAVGGE